MSGDPYRVSGPTCISFSGGRTSGYMLRRILDSHGGTLPADAHVIFANTGKEHAGTLDFVRDCSVRWGVPITWVEYDGRGGKLDYREVTHDSASRAGEPFARLIAQKKALPNWQARWCTAALKVQRARARACAPWATRNGPTSWAFAPTSRTAWRSAKRRATKTTR